jgi:hypothetical protein
MCTAGTGAARLGTGSAEIQLFLASARALILGHEFLDVIFEDSTNSEVPKTRLVATTEKARNGVSQKSRKAGAFGTNRY